MRLATLAFGGAVALAIGIPAATFISNAFSSATASLALARPANPDEPVVEIWVGTLCDGGSMRVGNTAQEVLEQGCQDTWTQDVNVEQARSMGL